MDTLGSDIPNTNRRRRHTAEFREEVLNTCEEPGCSVAEVARRYQLNANLIHKWRRDRERKKHPASPAFVPLLPLAKQSLLIDEATVKVELPGRNRSIILHWPLTQIDRLAHWLRHL